MALRLRRKSLFRHRWESDLAIRWFWSLRTIIREFRSGCPREPMTLKGAASRLVHRLEPRSWGLRKATKLISLWKTGGKRKVLIESVDKGPISIIASRPRQHSSANGAAVIA